MLEIWQCVVNRHGAHHDVVHEVVETLWLVEQLGLQFLAHRFHVRPRQHRVIGQHAEQTQPAPLQPAPGEVGNEIEFLRQHLVDDDADDFDPLLLEQRLVQRDFVDRFADAAARHNDHLGAENLGCPRIRNVEHRTHARMAGTFAQHEVLLPGNAVKGLPQPAGEPFIVRRFQIAAREIRLDGDRAHVHERTVQLVNAVHQHGVFVDHLLGDFDVALAHRLDVADTGIEPFQGRQQAERRGGLAVVLPGGSNEDARSK